MPKSTDIPAAMTRFTTEIMSNVILRSHIYASSSMSTNATPRIAIRAAPGWTSSARLMAKMAPSEMPRLRIVSVPSASSPSSKTNWK